MVLLLYKHKERMHSMIKGISLTHLFIDCQNPESLSEFYHRLTGWKKETVYDAPSLITENGLVILFAVCDTPYIPPVWPEKEGQQQKQMHFDFTVEDLDGSVDKAIELGATKAPSQYGENLWVTLLDPEGHPFCFGVNE